jgi:hypothetical protein
MRSQDDVARVRELVAGGFSINAISQLTGIPAGTISNWRSGRVPARGRERANSYCMHCGRYRFPFPELTYLSHAYLFGLYLGDGSISRTHPFRRLPVHEPDQARDANIRVSALQLQQPL